MSYERPQKGNPHRLTIDQHVYPAASIKRFGRHDGRVELYSLKHKKHMLVKPNNDIFCAKRAWDQGAEVGYQKNIEGAFQEIARGVINGSVKSLNIDDRRAICEFFSLWKFRCAAKAEPFEDVRLNIVGTSRALSLDDQEYLEKGNVGFIRPDCTMPGRWFASVQIKRNIDLSCDLLSDRRWGIGRSESQEFLVPDFIDDFPVIPIAPSVVLAMDYDDRFLCLADVAHLNMSLISKSREYIFARSFKCCSYAADWRELSFRNSMLVQRIRNSGVPDRSPVCASPYFSSF
jgi:hypothetical protein